MKPAILASAITAIAISLSGCTVDWLREKEPDFTTSFSSSPEEVADCVVNTMINEQLLSPLRSVRDGLLRISQRTNWELTLRPDGIAEVRGSPTIFGPFGKDVVPMVEACDRQIIEQKGS